MGMGDERFAAALEAVRTTPFEQRPGEPTPWGYYGRLFSANGDQSGERRKRLRYYADVFRVAGVDPAGLDILEAGSGFGIGLISIACLGAGSVTGVELVGWQADWARTCVSRLEPSLAARIRVAEGDVGSLPVADESLDVVLSLEAISHYLEYGPFLAEAGRVLRPGGRLIVSDGNNILNAATRRRTVEMWAQHEADPRIAPSAVPEGEYDPWQLVEHRRRVVLEEAPSLSDDEVWRLAFNTSGMVRSEIVEAVRRYLESGVEPDCPYRPGTLIVHPTQEIVIERLFDPYELGAEIAAHGFDVRVRGHWAGATGRGPRIANDVLAAMGRVTMRFARGFRIVATKR
jgi:SAM-dependent methyltransferase